MSRTISCFFSALFLLAPPLNAQQADSGMVHVTVEEPMGPVEGVLVRAAGRSTTTDGSGHARLTLPAGRQQLSLARIGYLPKRITVLVVRDSVVTIKVAFVMEEMAMELEEVRVSATRIERRRSFECHWHPTTGQGEQKRIVEVDLLQPFAELASGVGPVWESHHDTSIGPNRLVRRSS